MKMMICGDIHFGIRNNSVKYLDFQTKWFREELFPSLKKHKCDSIVFLGDVFDSRINLSPLVLQRVRQLFKELTSILDVYCIIGNHDIFFRNTKKVHSLEILEDQGVTVFENPELLKINNRKILFLPWIVKDEREDVEKFLVQEEYDVCFGHLEINNFEKVKGVVEKDGISQKLFSNCKKVYSGHFHLRRSQGHIHYTGTPYELTWNDYKDEKGLVLLDLDTLEDTFIKTKNTPKHLKLYTDKISKEEIDSALIKDNIIKLHVHSSLPEIEKIDYLEKINFLEPLMFSIDDESVLNFETEEDVEADIKDTMGFLTDFLQLTELPEGLELKKTLEILEDIHRKCI
jgi:DNA repair exonuclease SbcCD nuclease subunit